MTREEFEDNFYEALEVTYSWLDMDDIDDDDHDMRLDAYDERYHCSVCLVRGVLEILWPVVADYISGLESVNEAQ